VRTGWETTIDVAVGKATGWETIVEVAVGSTVREPITAVGCGCMIIDISNKFRELLRTNRTYAADLAFHDL